MPRDEIPYCNVDWTRLFSLPFGVPAVGIGGDERVQYAVSLDAASELPLSTHGRYFGPPDPLELRLVDEVVLPAYGRDLVAAVRATPEPAIFADRVMPLPKEKKAFNATVVSTGSVAEVDRELERRVPTDAVALTFAPIPIPRLSVDTVETFFADRPAPWLPAAPFAVPGAVDASGTPLAAVPELLLGSSAAVIGEHDRLLLRAPVTGRFRFDPYFLYRKTGAPALDTIGPSSTGRLVVWQPELSEAKKAAVTVVTEKLALETRTAVFDTRTFAFEHVSRDSVAEMIHSHLMFQLRHLEAFHIAHTGGAGAVDRLAIPQSSAAVMGWVVAGVTALLRSWVAFLGVLRWRQKDIDANARIPPPWVPVLAKTEPIAADAAALIPIAGAVVADAAFLESVVYFCHDIYARRLGGFSWTEVLTIVGAPAAIRFPVPEDQPPFTGTDPASKAAQLQHQQLRQLENPDQRWVACWAGAPIGRPAAVYAPAVAGTAFPANGVTTYEIEALHAANRAAPALGIAAPAASSQASPGRAADLSAFSSKRVGYGCWFTSGSGANPLYTTVDWLIELTQGTHHAVKERPFIDLHSLIDPATGRGHPLREPLRADDWLKATFLRSQMDALNKTTLGVDSCAWWTGNVTMPGVTLTPRDPYSDDETFVPAAYWKARFKGQAGFRAFFVPPFGSAKSLSGFGAFDLTSAMLATQRMSQPGSAPLPLAVMLGLMNTEGIRSFGAINRCVRNTTAADTLTWESLDRAPAAYDIRYTRGFYPADDDLMARQAWLSYPYGLDTFAKRKTDTALKKHLEFVEHALVFTLASKEDPGGFIRQRVAGFWHTDAPGYGFPVIWKLSRRAHWACLSLMAAWYRMLESDMHAAAAGVPRPYHVPVEGFVAGKPAAEWLPVGSSPPALIRGDGSRVGPNDVEWKDFLTYYGMIYIAYNAHPQRLISFMNDVDANIPGGWAHTKRDYLLFKHARGDEIIQRVVRLVIAMDAYMRLDYMESKAPAAYAAATPLATAPIAARWGIPPP